MRILTPEEAETLADARDILRELAHGFGEEAMSLPQRAASQLAKEGSWQRDHEMQDVGAATALANIAEGGIFDLLNHLTHHNEDERARMIIDRWHPPEQEPSEPEYVPTARQEQLEEMGEDRPF